MQLDKLIKHLETFHHNKQGVSTTSYSRMYKNVFKLIRKHRLSVEFQFKRERDFPHEDERNLV